MTRKRGKSGGKTGANLTPVRSIVFVIVLYFAAGWPFMWEHGFDPGGGEGCEDCTCSDTIVVRMDRHNRIFVEDGGKPIQVELRRLRTVLARRLAKRRACVLVDAGPHSDMETVARVMDQAEMAHVPSPLVIVATADS